MGKDMTLRKGTYVKHPKDKTHAEWGLGIVLDDERSGRVPVFFEHSSQRKIIGTDLVQLQKVQDPGGAGVLLDHALYEDKGDRQPFPLVLEMFLLNFPEGLSGELYIFKERTYKAEASEFARELLAKGRFADLLSKEDWGTLSTDIKRVYSKTNLLSSFEMIKLGAALKNDDNIKLVSNTLFDLLYSGADIAQKVESAALKLKPLELDKWPVITYLLFLIYPNDCMFVKPTMTKAAAENRGFDIQYESKVNANTYNRVLLFSQDLFQRLSGDSRQELHPRDMIDVQGFMWCTYGGGWTPQGLEQAKNQLEQSQG
jgi:hypothetical protein